MPDGTHPPRRDDHRPGDHRCREGGVDELDGEEFRATDDLGNDDQRKRERRQREQGGRPPIAEVGVAETRPEEREKRHERGLGQPRPKRDGRHGGRESSTGPAATRRGKKSSSTASCKRRMDASVTVKGRMTDGPSVASGQRQVGGTRTA